jgi:hypothetical protein
MRDFHAFCVILTRLCRHTNPRLSPLLASGSLVYRFFAVLPLQFSFAQF